LTRDIFTLVITESPREEGALLVVDEILERFEIQSTEEVRKYSSGYAAKQGKFLGG
jgi:hypothetical protein